MELQTLLDPEIQKFILSHEKDDVAALALKKPLHKDWPYKDILDQIKSRQKAAKKIPQWLEHQNILFPPSDIIEQASSSTTALYKAALVKGESFADLTGGAGVDTWAIAKNFKSGTCIEQNPDAAAMLRHNLPLLGCSHVEIQEENAETYIQNMPPVDLLYIDPQRRDNQRKGKYRLEDQSPDVLNLLPALKNKARTIILKTSPMLDIMEGIKQLGCVSEVHILEWNGDCKELLFLLGGETIAPENVPVHAVKLGDHGNTQNALIHTYGQEKEAMATFSMPLQYLYEPSPAFQKSGAFKTISETYGVHKLHEHTHLYTSENLCGHFPGRTFEVLGEYSLKQPPKLKKANITVRNFPSSPEKLRHKFKFKDGGEDTIFACTLENGDKKLIHARKA